VRACLQGALVNARALARAPQVLAQVEGPTSRAIREGGVKLGVANVPKNYRVRAGAQLE
jgi:hypothetical protein